MSENEMKNACIRLRNCNNEDFKLQNNLLPEIDIKIVEQESLNEFEERLNKFGYKKVFDTLKKGHHYFKENLLKYCLLLQKLL